jgi:hypothetical protein
MCEYLGNWPLCEEFPHSYTGINMNNYNVGGSAQGTNVVDPNLLFFDDDLDFPSEHNCFDPNLVEQYICHGPIALLQTLQNPMSEPRCSLNNVKIFSEFHIIQTMSMEHSFCMRQVGFMDYLM